MKKVRTHCFVAGQSGGHIIPCITLAQEIITKHPHDHTLFFTTNAPLDMQLSQSLSNSYTHIALPVSSCRGYNPLTYIIWALKLMYAFCVSFYHLAQHRPESITSTGGISTIPVALAAHLLRIPIDLYELNVLPGKTTYFLAPLARTLYCCFARTQNFLPAETCRSAAYPVRFFNEKHYSQAQACTELKLNPNKKTILIIGGSQGSLFINKMIQNWLTESDNVRNFQIIHQTGAYDTTDWYLLYKQHKITAITFAFSDNMAPYYAASDLVICRSGAGTLFELLYFHIPCITIPLETAHNAHQVHNAFTMAHEYPELFSVLTQDTLAHNSSALASTIDHVFETQRQTETPTEYQKARTAQKGLASG